MPGQQGQKSSKNSKLGRNSDKCARYRAEGRREKNKARRKAHARSTFRVKELPKKA